VLAAALGSGVAGATFVARPTSGKPTATATAVGNVGPVDGTTFAVLSTGDATLADTDHTQSDTADNVDGGSDVRGAHDVTILHLDLQVPADANCAAIAFDYLSDEAPPVSN